MADKGASEPDEKELRDRAKWVGHAEASSIGIEIVVSIVVGTLGGYYLEQNVTHWSPWTMLIGFAFGIGAAVNAVVRTNKDYQRRAKAEAEATGTPDAPATPAPHDGPDPEPPSKSAPAHKNEDL